jgi:hypothetical protein
LATPSPPRRLKKNKNTQTEKYFENITGGIAIFDYGLHYPLFNQHPSVDSFVQSNLHNWLTLLIFTDRLKRILSLTLIKMFILLLVS